MTTTIAVQIQRTPLFETHVVAGAKMVPFGGWEMPLHYGSQIEEHHATRKSCGLFDVSHMGQVEVIGPDAIKLVQELVTQDVSTLKDGEEVYTVMCRETGGLIDDLIVSRFSEWHYFLVVNAGTYGKDVEFMQATAKRMALKETELVPCAEQWAMIAVQGPNWIEVCRPALGAGDWEQLPPFKTLRTVYRGAELIFSTTGYTGEAGAELLCPPYNAVPLWEELVGAGGRPCGLAARDTLRLEKGYCLSGQDFTEADNPLEAGLGWVVKLSKDHFSGSEALKRVKAEGPKKQLIGLLPEGRRIPRHGAQILAGGKAAGEITSGGFSPSLNKPIAMGYLATEFRKFGTEVEIDLGSARIKAVIVKPPFYPEKSKGW